MSKKEEVDGVADEALKLDGSLPPEKKPRARRKASRMLLVRHGEPNAAGGHTLVPCKAGATIREMKKAAQAMEDGKYAIVCVRESFEISTTQMKLFQKISG